MAAYDKALQLRPRFAEVFCNLANLALDAGRYDEALRICQRALSIRADFPDALNLRGTTLRRLRRYEEAAAAYQQILAKDIRFGNAMSHLLVSRAHVCNWSDREAQVSHIVDRIVSGECASAPHAFLWICDSAPLQLACASLYTREEFPASQPLWQGERWRHQRLRVAYLSADFADHPVAHLIAGVLEHHDRSRFETFGVSLQGDPGASAMGLRMQRTFEHFHDAREAGDRDVAALLREREIDIAVDLTGHTHGGRLGILALRPAPLQLNFLGFAGTSGASYMDYLVGDSVATPGELEGSFTERIIRMPYSFLPNDDRRADRRRTAATPRSRLAGVGIRVLRIQQHLQAQPGDVRCLDAAVACSVGQRAVAEGWRARRAHQHDSRGRRSRSRARAIGFPRRSYRPWTSTWHAIDAPICFSTHCRMARTQRRVMPCGRGSRF